MLGNFTYHNPTKLYFGENSVSYLDNELKQYGKKVLLVYGGGSIIKSGLYDRVMKILKKNNKEVEFDKGVMPNPTLDKLMDGLKIARKFKPDLILAVGGGSVIDYAKALNVSIYEKDDPWQKFYVRFEEPSEKLTPLGCILTMAGTGSEMNGGAVITNTKTGEKIGHVFNSEVFPKFAILDPTLTYSLPHYQMIAGVYDAFNHVMEQYFSNDDDNVSDDMMEGLMRSLKKNGLIAAKSPDDYIARSNIMWASTWALNTFVGKGKTQDWMVHMLGQAIGGITNATHGMTLSAVSLAYYRFIMPYAIDKFASFAKYVFDVNPNGKTNEQIAKEGLDELEKWMKEMGLVLSVQELGVTKENLDQIVANVFPGGAYKPLTKEDIKKIILDSF